MCLAIACPFTPWVLAPFCADASNSTCCQCSGVVRVWRPQAFALSPALLAARLNLC